MDSLLPQFAVGFNGKWNKPSEKQKLVVALASYLLLENKGNGKSNQDTKADDKKKIKKQEQDSDKKSLNTLSGKSLDPKMATSKLWRKTIILIICVLNAKMVKVYGHCTRPMIIKIFVKRKKTTRRK